MKVKQVCVLLNWAALAGQDKEHLLFEILQRAVKLYPKQNVRLPNIGS